MSGDTWTGRLIDGRYVVDSIIGQGGMGVVLKARHKFTSAQVALKMLQPDLQMNEEAKERFLREAQTPTTIGHPGIVQVHDAGVTPEGELYIAMELLTGRTLRQAMYPTIPPQVARRILLELLDALGAAHARGIIHRDLKPENVFLSGPAHTVKLLDFGIAKMVQAGRTAAGMMLGTLSYMAPEQLSDASTVDARADLWAVGVMVYEMLTGKLPFRGTQLAEIMTALATQEPDPIGVYLPEATPAMKSFFASALAKDRNRRFASSQDMAMSVSAMLIEGTAPPMSSTLNGLGSPRSSQMTAADSGPLPSRQQPAVSAPRPAVSAPQSAQVSAPQPAASAPYSAQHTPFTPHVPPPGAPFAAPGTPNAPVTAPGTPNAPVTTPGTPNAFTAPTPFTAPGTPNAFTALTPFTAPQGPAVGPYGFVNHAPAMPPRPGQPYGFVDQARKPAAGGLGLSSWLILGGVGVVLVILVFVVNNVMSNSKGFVRTEVPTECPAICTKLSKCPGSADMDQATCNAACDTMPKFKKCYADAEGLCFSFLSCINDEIKGTGSADPEP